MTGKELLEYLQGLSSEQLSKQVMQSVEDETGTLMHSYQVGDYIFLSSYSFDDEEDE